MSCDDDDENTAILMKEEERDMKKHMRGMTGGGNVQSSNTLVKRVLHRK